MSAAPAWVLRLATRAHRRRDGELVLVNAEHTRCQPVPDIAATLQSALDDWATTAPALVRVREALDAGAWQGAEAFHAADCLAPLPRAYQFADASVYRQHAALMYRWRQQPLPPRYEEEPLVYQGGSDVMLAPAADIVARSAAHGLDFEAEVAVITTDVPMGTSAEAALRHIALVALVNDVSLRHLIAPELARGFGFYQSKPASSMAPVVCTPAALGECWWGAMLQRPVRVTLNGQWFGEPHAAEDTLFHFGQVMAHLAATRALGAGSVVGAGTISNAGNERGSACITEARVRQALAGMPESGWQPYLQHGDVVRIEAFGTDGRSLFGAIQQRVAITSS